MRRVLVFFDMFIVFIILCVVLVKVNTPDIEIIKDKVYRLDTDNFGYYETTEATNSINCDLTTFSSIVNSMLADGYVIDKESNYEEGIDLMLSKDSLTFRLYYSNNENLTSICKFYEKSYIPFTYINEK